MPHARRLRVLSPRHPQLQKQNLFERSLGRAQPPPVVMSALAFQRFFFSPSGTFWMRVRSCQVCFFGGRRVVMERAGLRRGRSCGEGCKIVAWLLVWTTLACLGLVSILPLHLRPSSRWLDPPPPPE